jgi:hypothetical protein
MGVYLRSVYRTDGRVPCGRVPHECGCLMGVASRVHLINVHLMDASHRRVPHRRTFHGRARYGHAPHWHASHRRVHHGCVSCSACLIGVYLNAAFDGRWCCISHFDAK